MKIRIDGGAVVGWSGTHHELAPDGSVLIEGDSIGYVGAERRPADKILEASGKLICPGFINLHVHSQLNVGDYLITDSSKRDYLSANYFVFGAPVKEKAAPPPPESVAIGREYALFSALKNGATTILDPGGGPRDLDQYAEIVGKLGGRVFFSPPYRSHDIFTDGEGRHYYEARPDGSRQGLQRAVEFIRSPRIDEDELFARSEGAAKRAWDNWPKRDWAGRTVDEIVPPAFPTRR
jgi:cytosine/adenosine deaminase-related metal-dependent hydrolase